MKLKNYEKIILKLTYRSLRSVRAAVFSLIGMGILLIPWGIILFIFDVYDGITLSFTKITDTIIMWSLMTPFILNGSIAILALIMILFGSIYIKAFIFNRKKYNVEDPNVDISNNTAYYAAGISGNTDAQLAAGLANLPDNIAVMNHLIDQLDYIIAKEKIKVKVILPYILYIVTILSMLVLNGATLYDKINTKNYIVASTQKASDLIRDAYADYNADFIVDGKIGASLLFTVKYKNVHMLFEPDKHGKINSLMYRIPIDGTSVDENLIDEIEQTIKELHSQSYKYSSIIESPEIINADVTFSDEIREGLKNISNTKKFNTSYSKDLIGNEIRYYCNIEIPNYTREKRIEFSYSLYGTSENDLYNYNKEYND